MRVLKDGLTEEQLIDAQIVDYTFSGKPLYYRWGEWNKLYYVTGIFDSSDLKEIPRNFMKSKASPSPPSNTINYMNAVIVTG
jgi:hypothetical protein